MPRPKQPPITGTDVRLCPRRDVNRIETYRVADDEARTVYVRCEFTNWQSVPTHTGIPPGGTWSQWRKLGSQNGPLAREARRMAK